MLSMPYAPQSANMAAPSAPSAPTICWPMWSKSLLQRNTSIDVNAIEDIIAGDANQAGEDNRNVARMAALLAGLPVTVAGNTVNRLCASGLQAIMDAARAIMCNEGELYIAGGVESMTRAPFVMAKAGSRLEPDYRNARQYHWLAICQ